MKDQNAQLGQSIWVVERTRQTSPLLLLQNITLKILYTLRESPFIITVLSSKIYSVLLELKHFLYLEFCGIHNLSPTLCDGIEGGEKNSIWIFIISG